MTYEALKPFLAAIMRHLLTLAAGALATHGIINSSGSEQFIGFGMTCAGLAWSWWSKTGHAAVAQDIANLRAILAARAAGAVSPLPKLQPGGTVEVPGIAQQITSSQPPAAKV